MKRANKLIALSVAAAIGMPAAAYAASTSIPAVANFLATITLGNEVTMNFGTVEFSAAPSLATDWVTIGTDASLAYNGVFSGSGLGGVAGAVSVTGGTDGNNLDVSCSVSATMTDGAGASIDVVNTEVVIEGGAAAFGAGNACAGVGTTSATMNLDIGGGTADLFSFGGKIDGTTAAAFVAGAYSTANAGGTALNVQVIYQ